ncbi:MAG: exonuclease SbcCD subunit D [Anaerolineae bacterium]|nr:MAG: exonuclease SbcCD subunit D [Anaerolineae bacterium]
MTIKLLHFADAHIDMANYGRHDPESGLPVRVMDFLKSLDTIVDAAIIEKVDLVIFAGDAYKDRSPQPTFQREWGRRIKRLANAGIPTLLLVGNHDLSPSIGRAHALEEFKTLQVPNVYVADEPTFYRAGELGGLPVQVMAMPWVNRSGMLAFFNIQASDVGGVYEELESKINELVWAWIEEADETLPTIFTAHASVQGAAFGGERTVMLGADLVLSGSLARNPAFDYVALGHIHKPQNLGGGPGPGEPPDTPGTPNQPPVIYPGSIERVDFGEASDRKYYIIAEVGAQQTRVEWRELTGIRTFIDRRIELTSDKDVTGQLRRTLPDPEAMRAAIVRLTIDYPRDWETLIDEAALRELALHAFEFHLVKRPQMESRIRLPEDQSIGSLAPTALLEIYWKSAHTEDQDREALLKLADDVIQSVNGGGDES